MKTLSAWTAIALFAVACGGSKGTDNQAQNQISPEEQKEVQALEAQTAELENTKEEIKKTTAELDNLLKGL